MEATINNILREWRDLWPGGLAEEQYSTLNLMAHCREGTLGFNCAKCDDCRQRKWYASSCGDRHCPNCLGPRQAQWSEQVCGRLADCPHFHVVFTMPSQLDRFFEANYRLAADELFAAAAETLKLFQENNWRMAGGCLAVLHTWGSALNWHPHLHVLASAGGMDLATGRWREARRTYLFPVKAMSKVFRSIFLRRLEALDADPAVNWPASIDTVEARRDWRVDMARRNWNIYSRPTLGNTRAVVRYLARYTSRIAISNQRITDVDPVARTVSFNWKDYKGRGQNKGLAQTKELTLAGSCFLRSFTRHLVPKGFRRVRYFGLLAGRKGRIQGLPGAPSRSIAERAARSPRPCCTCCGGQNWSYLCFYTNHAIVATEHASLTSGVDDCATTGYRFSLACPRARP
jgi:hypothetical protein